MLDLTRAPSQDPAIIYKCRDELYSTDMLIAALNGLDFFTWLDTQPSSLDAIARHFNLHRRPLDVMTTLFVAMGFLTRDGEVLHLTELAREQLVASSPWFLGPYFPKVSDRPIARDLLEILASDRPANFASRANEQDWHKAMEKEEVAAEFTAAMDRRGLLLAQALAKQIDFEGRSRLLDVAGGSGIYACSFAAHFPQLTGSIFEKSPVDRIAARSIASRGFSDRIGVVSGDMLASALPDGYDIHLWSNVIHDWNVDIVRQLLAASARALAPGGLILIHDAFLNADKSGPLSIAAYSVLLLHVTQGRCYSIAEMESWLDEAGFDNPRVVPSAIGRSAILARRR